MDVSLATRNFGSSCVVVLACKVVLAFLGYLDDMLTADADGEEEAVEEAGKMKVAANCVDEDVEGYLAAEQMQDLLELELNEMRVEL
jgi:hypothetical protein